MPSCNPCLINVISRIHELVLEYPYNSNPVPQWGRRGPITLWLNRHIGQGSQSWFRTLTLSRLPKSRWSPCMHAGMIRSPVDLAHASRYPDIIN